MQRLGLLVLFALTLFLLPAAASATVIESNGLREDSAFTATGQVYAEGTAGLGKYVWFVDQAEGEAILRGYDQGDPTNPGELAVVDGTPGVGLGPIGSVGGIAFLAGSARLLVLDKANDRLFSYARSNDGSVNDPVDYAAVDTRSHDDTDRSWFDLKDPDGLAVDPSGPDRVYISDTGHRRVLELDGSLKWFRQLTQPWWGPATRPGALAVDHRTGRLFVSIQGGARIESYKRDLVGREPTLTAPSAGDFIALSAEPSSNRLFAAKQNEIHVFSLSTSTLLGTIAAVPFGNSIAGISATENLRDFHLASFGQDRAQSYMAVAPPECTTPASPLTVSPGETVRFTPSCDDPDHSTLKEFSIEDEPVNGSAQVTDDRSAIDYTAGGAAAPDVVKFKVMTQDGLSALYEYPINVAPQPTITLEAPADGAQFGSPVTASFATTNASTVTCTWDSEPPIDDCESPLEPKTLAAGVHVFQVDATSSDGVSASVANSFTVVEPPAISITAPINVQVVGSPATATFTLGGGTPDEVSCQWDQEPVINPCSSPQGPKALSPGQHTFTVTAINAAEAVSVTSSFFIAAPVQAAAAPDPVPAAVPVIRVSTNLQLESGEVFVKLPGSKTFIKLTQGLLVPIGTLVDATNGKVQLTLANADKSQYNGSFWGGVFQPKQGGGDKPLATMKLRPGDGVDGDAVSSSDAEAAGSFDASIDDGPYAVTAARRGKKKGGLWGNGKGKFRTSGGGGSATVRGTRWYVADYEKGTFFKVTRGSVTIDPIRGRNFTLRSGNQFFIFYKRK